MAVSIAGSLALLSEMFRDVTLEEKSLILV